MVWCPQCFVGEFEYFTSICINCAFTYKCSEITQSNTRRHNFATVIIVQNQMTLLQAREVRALINYFDLSNSVADDIYAETVCDFIMRKRSKSHRLKQFEEEFNLSTIIKRYCISFFRAKGIRVNRTVFQSLMDEAKTMKSRYIVWCAHELLSRHTNYLICSEKIVGFSTNSD